MIDAGGAAPDAGRRGAGWEVPEILAAVLVTAVTVMAVGNLAAGLVGAATLHSPRYDGTFLLGDVLAAASGWAVLALLLLAATLGLLWRQVTTWSQAEPAPPTDEACAPEADTEAGDDRYRAAADHLVRARRLAVWIGVLLLVTAAAAAAYWVAVLLEYVGFPGQLPPIGWEQVVGNGAASVALLAAVAAGLFLVVRIVRRCAAWTNRGPDGSQLDSSGPPDSGPATGAADTSLAGAVTGSATPS